MKILAVLVVVLTFAGCSSGRSSFAQLSTAENAARDIVAQTRYTQPIVVQRTNFYGTASYTPGAR
jgi:hypothetical protein